LQQELEEDERGQVKVEKEMNKLNTKRLWWAVGGAAVGGLAMAGVAGTSVGWSSSGSRSSGRSGSNRIGGRRSDRFRLVALELEVVSSLS